MKRSYLAVAAALSLLAVPAIVSAQPAPPPAPPKPCNPPLGWWENPKLPILFTNPNGAAPMSDCDFQVWSWTTFAHWIQNDPKTGQPLFLGLPTYADLKSGDALRAKAGPRTLALSPRTQKPRTVSSVDQAFGGAMIDQNGRALYYSSHMDPIEFAFTQKYFGPAKYAKAAPMLNYPIGSTVFKAAWRIVQPGEDTSTVFTTTATIDLLESDGKGGLQTNGQSQAGVTVALVGMHVVGVVKDHPEFIWATFEQNNNAPDLPAGMSPTSSSPVSAQSYTFYKAGTPANQSNISSSVAPQSINVATQVISPVTNVFRQFPFGGATPASRVADIMSLNKGSAEEIKNNKTINPAFANYHLIGSVWILANTLKPGDGTLDQQAIGSLTLANSTLETFAQGTGFNCFSCHTTSAGATYPGKDINLNHMLLSVLPKSPSRLNANP